LNEAKDWNTAAFASSSIASATIARLESERDQLKKQFEISKGNTEAALNSFHAEAKQRRSAEAERDQLKELLNKAFIKVSQYEMDTGLDASCKALVAERDQLRKVAADFHDCMVDVRQQMQMDKMLRQPIPRAPLELQIDETIELYNSLPHVIAKNTK
jgi:hypothetical protein